MGRPSIYTPELASRIVELVEGGGTLRSIEKMEGLPSAETIRVWMHRHEPFREQILRAREEAADEYEARMLEEAELAVDVDSAAAARVRIGTLQWIAERRSPRRYGAKLDLHHTVVASVADALAEARRRTALLDGPSNVVDLVPIPVAVDAVKRRD